MMREMTNREWEALSAYLDNELDPRERARLETRLREDQDLRMALGELRHTRAALRSQPRIRAPRNFTLTPEMAGIRGQSRPAGRAYPFFRLASALATIVLVLVLVGDFFTAKPAAVAITRSTAPMAAPLTAQEAPAATNALPGIGGSNEQEPQGAVPESSAADQATGEPSMGVLAQPPLGTPEPSAQPLLSLAPNTKGTPLAEQAAPAAKASPTETPAEAQAQVLQAPPAFEPTPTEVVRLTQPPESTRVPDLRYIEIGLAVVALLSGLAALYLRRMGST